MPDAYVFCNADSSELAGLLALQETGVVRAAAPLLAGRHGAFAALHADSMDELHDRIRHVRGVGSDHLVYLAVTSSVPSLPLPPMPSKIFPSSLVAFVVAEAPVIVQADVLTAAAAAGPPFAATRVMGPGHGLLLEFTGELDEIDAQCQAVAATPGVRAIVSHLTTAELAQGFGATAG